MKAYYRLTKPGIIYGNALTFTAGAFLASEAPRIGLFLGSLLGVSFIVASGCVFNNYIDRDIDAVMERTKMRELPRGIVPLRHALMYGALLLLLGVVSLYYFSNPLTLLVTLFGFIIYVGAYSLWAKRGTMYGTLIGAVAGAVPPVAGYTAVTDHLDLGALLLFLILIFWQMPHFFAIAMNRIEDYSAAHIPAMPVLRGMKKTRSAIVAYVVLFLVATHLLHYFGYAGSLYALIMGITSLLWLALALRGSFAKSEKQWARSMFLASLLVIVIFAATIVFAT